MALTVVVKALQTVDTSPISSGKLEGSEKERKGRNGQMVYRQTIILQAKSARKTINDRRFNSRNLQEEKSMPLVLHQKTSGAYNSSLI